MFEPLPRSAAADVGGVLRRGVAVGGAAGEWLEELIDLGVPVVRVAGPQDLGEPPVRMVASSRPDVLAMPVGVPISELVEAPPCGRVLAGLEQLRDEDVDDYDAVDSVAVWDALEAYCAAGKRAAAAALARRRRLEQGLAGLSGVGVETSEVNVAADEIAMRLGLGKRAAGRLISAGRLMQGAGLATGQALRAGRLRAAVADAICEAIDDLDGDAALAVQDRVLPKAGFLSVPAVRRELAAACSAVVPDRYEAQAERAATLRHVNPPRVLPYGMAGMYAVLPAVEAAGLYRAVDAAARSAKAGGDPRTMDQLRADALAAMGTAALTTGWIGPAPGLTACECVTDPSGIGRGQARRLGPSAESGVFAGGGSCEQPSESAASTSAQGSVRAERPPGPRGAGGADQRSGPASPGDERVSGPVDPGDEGRTRGPSSTVDEPWRSMKVGVIGGASAQVRVTIPFTMLMDAAALTPEPEPGPDRGLGTDHGSGPVRGSGPDGGLGSGLDPGRRSGLDRARGSGLDPGRGSDRGAESGSEPASGIGVDVVGDDGEAPDDIESWLPSAAPDELTIATLQGYGPIPAAVARAVAAGGVWARMVIDPVDRTVLEVSREQYQPPAAMAALVRAGQPLCARPGCGVNADACDLNHRIPWPVGATEVSNLDPLCRRDHLLITHADWRYDQREDRSRTWTTTSGHSYAEHPDGTLAHLPRDATRRLAGAVGGATATPPPF